MWGAAVLWAGETPRSGCGPERPCQSLDAASLNHGSGCVSRSTGSELADRPKVGEDEESVESLGVNDEGVNDEVVDLMVEPGSSSPNAERSPVDPLGPPSNALASIDADAGDAALDESVLDGAESGRPAAMSTAPNIISSSKMSARQRSNSGLSSSEAEPALDAGCGSECCALSCELSYGSSGVSSTTLGLF